MIVTTCAGTDPEIYRGGWLALVSSWVFLYIMSITMTECWPSLHIVRNTLACEA